MVVPSCFRLRGTRDAQNEIESSPRPALVYLYSSQSNLCKLIKPTLDERCDELTDRYSLIAVDVAEESDPFHEWRIWQVPTFIIYRDGEELRRLSNLEFGDRFVERFERFALHQFLLHGDERSILDRFDFFRRVKEGSHLHLVTVMRPGEAVNRELETVLDRLDEKHSRELEIHLVNARESPQILDWFGIESTPYLLAFREGDRVRSWSSTADFHRLETAVQELVS